MKYNSLHNRYFLKKIAKLIDKQTGIIKNIKGYIFYLCRKFFLYEAEIKFNEYISAYNTSQKHGLGIGFDKESALCSCIGEAIERYCGTFYIPKDYIVNSYEELKNKAVNIRELTLYSEAQYKQKKIPYNPTPEKLKVRWVKGYSLTKKKYILVPAHFVGLSSSHCLREEHFISQVTSTGLACGYIEEEAILNGIYEVIERDAFNIMWYNCLPMPHVIITEKLFREVIKEITSVEGLEIYIIDMTTDFQIPSFCTMILNKKDIPPLVCFGAAANLNPRLAIKKSFLEAIHTFFFLFMNNYYKGIKEYKIEQLISFSDHALFYAHSSKRPILNFIKDHRNRILDSDISDFLLGDKKKDLKFCIDLLKKKGYDIIVVNITLPDISELGLYVVRVFVPEALPLRVGVDQYPGGGRRLYEVPKKLKYRCRNTTERELNPNPHPFP
jgi:ribosomal protein S12 methylthiotransferase accessory factor